MRAYLVITLIWLLGLASACHPAHAQIPPEEIEVVPHNDDSGAPYSFELSWKDYRLSIYSYPPEAMVTFMSLDPDDASDYSYLWFEPDEECPPLELPMLPSVLARNIETCASIAAGALEKDKTANALTDETRKVLSLVSKRMLTVEDYGSSGGLHLSWTYSYRGKERILEVSYSDAEARFEVKTESGSCTLTLQEDPSPYSAEVVLDKGKLSAKALDEGGEALPNEAELLDFLRKLVSRAHGLVASQYSGAPDDVVETLRNLSSALSAAERFATYEQLEEPICPT